MPADLTERLLGLEAYEQIRQLASRYALGVDTRDLDYLVNLFVDNVRVGRSESGRPALRAYFDRILRHFTTSFHLVGNHVIDLDDADHAHGVVYCRAEHELGASWVIQAMQYWDTYERRGEQWYFVRRRSMALYGVDMLERPIGGQRMRWPDRPRDEAPLPGAWPAWAAFWPDGA